MNQPPLSLHSPPAHAHSQSGRQCRFAPDLSAGPLLRLDQAWQSDRHTLGEHHQHLSQTLAVIRVLETSVLHTAQKAVGRKHPGLFVRHWAAAGRRASSWPVGSDTRGSAARAAESPTLTCSSHTVTESAVDIGAISMCSATGPIVPSSRSGLQSPQGDHTIRDFRDSAFQGPDRNRS